MGIDMTPFGPLAITADDYGLTDGINKGIASLAQRQAITGVSVMCHPAARLEQTALLKNSGVLTGVHLVLSEERPLLTDDPGLNPILDRRGRLPDSRSRLFRLILLKPWVLPALKREVEAQINRFAELGLSLDFINSHQHVHLFPPLWLILRPLLESYKVPIRGTARWDWQGWSPQGKINLLSWLSWRLGPRRGHALSLKPMGINAAGHFSLEAAKELLFNPSAGSRREVPELIVHPGRMDRSARDYYSHWRYQWEQEWETLASESMQTLLEQNGCDLLGATMKIREQGPETSTFATRPNASEVVFGLIWPQSWDQMVLFTRLLEGSTRKGVAPRYLLSDLLFGLERHHFEHYRGCSTGRRLLELWFWVRTLAQRIDNDAAVVHLLLPSPAWAWIFRWIKFPGERMVLHYSGRTVAWNWMNLKEFPGDPWLVGRAMLTNPEFLSRFARGVQGAHLTMDARSAETLTALGCKRVFQCPGLIDPWIGLKNRVWERKGKDADSSVLYAGFSGLGSPVEGILDLLRATSMAALENPRLRLILAVEEKHRLVKLKQRILDLGLRDRVMFVDVEEEARLLAQVDVMVLPYRSAMVAPLYPRPLMVAAASGCPLITTAIPAWEHLFHLGSPGLELISPGDVGALRRVLVTLMDRLDRAGGGPLPLKPLAGHQGMEAVSTIHQRLAGGRFIPSQC